MSVEAVAIGNKGFGFLNRIGAKVVSQPSAARRRAAARKLIGPVKVMLDEYRQGRLDAVDLCFTKFINTMKQEPVVRAAAAAVVGRRRRSAGGVGSTAGTTSTSRTRPRTIDELLTRYVEALVYRAVADNMAWSSRRAWSR